MRRGGIGDRPRSGGPRGCCSSTVTSSAAEPSRPTACGLTFKRGWCSTCPLKEFAAEVDASRSHGSLSSYPKQRAEGAGAAGSSAGRCMERDAFARVHRLRHRDGHSFCWTCVRGECSGSEAASTAPEGASQAAPTASPRGARASRLASPRRSRPASKPTWALAGAASGPGAATGSRPPPPFRALDRALRRGDSDGPVSEHRAYTDALAGSLVRNSGRRPVRWATGQPFVDL